MKKIISILSLCCCLNISLISQITLSVPSQNINSNTTSIAVPVNITADYPLAVIGWQFFIEWDENVLTFQSISDLSHSTLNLQDFGTPAQTGKNGQLSFVWENYPENIVLSGESQLFVLHFQVNPNVNVSHTMVNFCEHCVHEMYKTNLDAVQLFYQNSQITFDGNLPLEWLTFNAKIQDNEQVALNWQTVNEAYTRHFDIQRSQEGLAWSTIGQVAVLPSTATPKKYDFMDKKPLLGVNMYRLKQVDEDGKFSYSDIRTLDFKKEERIFEYQNPVNKTLSLRWINPKMEKMVFNLYDVQGKLLRQQVQEFSEGPQWMTWNVADLASGLYFLEVIGAEIHTFKVVKE